MTYLLDRISPENGLREFLSGIKNGRVHTVAGQECRILDNACVFRDKAEVAECLAFLEEKGVTGFAPCEIMGAGRDQKIADRMTATDMSNEELADFLEKDIIDDVNSVEGDRGGSAEDDLMYAHERAVVREAAKRLRAAAHDDA